MEKLEHRHYEKLSIEIRTLFLTLINIQRTWMFHVGHQWRGQGSYNLKYNTNKTGVNMKGV